MAHFRVQDTLLLAVSTIVGALCLLNCHYKILTYNHVSKYISPHESFSIMTFNIAAYDSTCFCDDKQDRLMDLIEHENPDIICFQELSSNNLRRIKHLLDSIYGPCEELDGRDVEFHRSKFYSYYRMQKFKRYHCVGDVNTEGVILNEKERITIDKNQKQMSVMSAEFEIKPNHWVTIFSGHLYSSAYSTARRSMDKDASWLSGLILYWRNYKVGKRIRDYEAENVRRFIEEAREEGMPVIVAGDLNDWCGSDCLNTLCEGSKSSNGSSSSNDRLKDAWWEGGNGFGWTYFGWHLRLRLDHILYSDELELVDVKVIDSDLSDHKPLMARFRVK